MERISLVQNQFEIKHSKWKESLITRLLFCNTWNIFKKGLQKDLDFEDLNINLPQYDSNSLGDIIETKWDSVKNHSKYSLAKIICKIFGYPVIKYGLLLFMTQLLKLVQPFCLIKIMEYFTLENPKGSMQEPVQYGLIIVFASLVNVILSQHFLFSTLVLGMNIRTACGSLIYRKSLKMSKSSGVATGQVINLLSNDVYRFDKLIAFIHYLWIAPLQMITVTVLLYNMFGFYGITGIIIIAIFMPVQIYLGKLSSKFRFKIATKTDRRIILLNEIISGIQLIKMYTWEAPFSKLIELTRRKELKNIQSTSYIRAIHMSMAMFVHKSSILLCFLICVCMGLRIDATFIFVVTAFYNTLKEPLSFHFPRSIALLTEATISIRRINSYLLLEQHTKANIKKVEGHAVEIKRGSTRWLKNLNQNTLTDINLTANTKEITAIVGQVGSGKTTLLSVILGELPLESGHVYTNGTISYASQDPWIFTRNIRENILFGYELDIQKYNEVCKLCCLDEDFELLPYGDKTLVGEKGVTLSGGQKARINLARAIYRNADMYLLDNPLSAVDNTVANKIFENCFVRYLKDKCVILLTNHLNFLNQCHKIYILNNGTIEASGTFDELKHLNYNFTHFQENNMEEQTMVETVVKNANSDTEDPPMYFETRNTGEIAIKQYINYFAFGRSYLWITLIFVLFIGSQILVSFADYLGSIWANLDKYPNFLNEHFKEIVIGIIILIIVVILIRSIFFMIFCIRVSRNLHGSMLDGILNTNMRFFNQNPTGRILNRFTKDMGAIDETLPQVLLNTLQIGLNVVGVVMVVIVANYWLIIPSLLIFLLFFTLRYIYLSSNRDILRLEGTTKSLVFHHMITTMQGLSTIKAFEVQKILRKEFDYLQNVHNTTFYNFLSCNATFGFWLDFLSVLYVGMVTFSFLVFDGGIFSGNVGLAITQALSLTGIFQWGMKQWAEVENQMVAFERAVEYTNLEIEENSVHVFPPETWPSEGQVTFKDVCMQYDEEGPFVLKRVSLDIRSQEKIGVVGRTGSGKSSLIVALLRLCEIKGEILIDSVDTSFIPIKALRSKIGIIPQVPVLFSGTIKENLDPLNVFQDFELKNALIEVGVSIDLNQHVEEGGVNFSVGQRQLLCLARALVRKTKIVILDEATANVDLVTDKLIQSIIKRRFVECTVITIAHRLSTIMDSDRVIVFDCGQVIEFDSPKELLQNKGVFFKMALQGNVDIKHFLKYNIILFNSS